MAKLENPTLVYYTRPWNFP